VNTGLNLDGPYSPEATLRAAGLAAEAVRYLNHATMHREAIAYPSEADALIRELAVMAGRLPQLLGQIGARVNAEHEAGRIRLASGTGLEAAAYAVLAATSRLESASEYASLLQQALARAALVTSGMAVQEDGSDD
jgi:hypothetical protein